MTVTSTRISRVATLLILSAAGLSVAADAKFKILNPGAEPRARLVFKPVKDSIQFTRMSFNNQMKGDSGGGKKMEMKSPSIAMEMISQVTAVSEEGAFKVQATLHKGTVTQNAESDPRLIPQMTQAVRQQEGSRATAEWKANGEKLEGVEQADPMAMGGMGDMSSNMAVIFPEEPLGRGAKWEYQSMIKQQGLLMDVNYAFELIEIEGDRLKVKADMNATAPKQTLQIPQLPPNALAELLSATLTASAISDIDLTKPNPVKATQKFVNDSQMKITNAGPEPVTMNQHVDMSILIEEIEELSAREPTAAPAFKPPAPNPAPKTDGKPAAKKPNAR